MRLKTRFVGYAIIDLYRIQRYLDLPVPFLMYQHKLVVQAQLTHIENLHRLYS